MKILITGGAGFIGSNLIKHLIDDNDIMVIDNFHTGSHKNIDKVRKNKEIKVHSCSCKCLSNVDYKFNNVDVIIHLGIPSSTPMYKENIFLVGETIGDAISIFEYAKENNINKIIYASTSSIYNKLEPPHKEDMIPLITDYYTETRIAIERLSYIYNDLYGIKSVGLRFFSVYGNNEEYKRKYANMITQFMWDIKKGVSPIIYGDGNQTRDFTYVDDIIQAIMIFINSDFEQDIYNVGTGISYSFNEIIDILSDLLNVDVKPTYVKNPIKNYVDHTLADITKIRKLGYEPKYDVRSGIKNILQGDLK